MTIQEMKERKRELGLTNEMLSGLSGIPLSTIQKVFSGQTVAPRKGTVDALVKVLGDQHMVDETLGRLPSKPEWLPQHGNSKYTLPAAGTSMLREPPLVYGTSPKKETAAADTGYGNAQINGPHKEQGSYTLEDYYALPDERRVELIDGVIYDMTAPYTIHQIILGELYILFRECVGARPEKNCRVFFAPCDVRLDLDNRTMVQPDLLVLCNRKQMTERRIEGAPDLVLEILSASTRKKDMFLKLFKYRNAGVREYWIVDPRSRKILVYIFDGQDELPKEYGFEDQIPIGISEGTCSIDFSRVNEQLIPLAENLSAGTDNY